MEMRLAPGRSADGASQHTEPPVDLKSATGRDKNRASHIATKRRSRALGGVAAQGSQAAASFVLQILVLRLLGADGLGRFATLYAIIVLATAVSSGFVGDSLTVLDRSDRRTRAGLQCWWLGLAVGSGLCAWLVSWLSGLLTPTAAIAFGLVTAVFILEDALRRLLMANLRFWRIVAVDLSSLAATIVAVLIPRMLSGTVSLALLLTALAVGQAIAIVVAVPLLPPDDRRLVRLFPADWLAVSRYGSFRAMQQGVRPALLALVKTLCLVLVGAAAAGRLEAARIYTAPTLLIVSGVSSVLFASYAAANRATSDAVLLSKADRSVGTLVAAIAAFCLAAVAALPWLGPILTGGGYQLSILAVIGWSVYAASVAAVTPYGSLAAVRGRQTAVLCLRVADSALSLAAAVLLLHVHQVDWVPFAMSVGSLLGGVAIRQLLLRGKATGVAPELQRVH